MQYRSLGDSGLLVSELALGTMIFGEESERSASPEEAERMVTRFLEAGGNHIDTANVYAAGRSEEIVGRAIRGKREKVVLATKVRFPVDEGPNDAGLSRRHIQRSVEDSLRRLQTDFIDLLYMHSWDALTPLEESLRAFDDLVTAGKILYVGVSNFKAWQLMKGLAISDANGWARFVAGQYQYSLVVRDIESEFIDLCEREGVGLIPWGPLGGGFLSGKYSREKPPHAPDEGRLAVTPDAYEEAWDKRATEQNWEVLDVLKEIVTEHPGATLSQVAIAWLLAKPVVSSVIIGVRRMEQLEDNLGALTLQLSPEEVAKLDQASFKPEPYPYRIVRTTKR